MTDITDVANYIALLANTEPKYEQRYPLTFRRMKYLLMLTQAFSVHALRSSTFAAWFEIGTSGIDIPKFRPENLRKTANEKDEWEFKTPESDFNPRKVLNAAERELIRDVLYALRGWRTANIHALIVSSLPLRLRPTEYADYTPLSPADLAEDLSGIELRYVRYDDGGEGAVIKPFDNDGGKEAIVTTRDRQWYNSEGDLCEPAYARVNGGCRCHFGRRCQRD